MLPAMRRSSAFFTCLTGTGLALAALCASGCGPGRHPFEDGLRELELNRPGRAQAAFNKALNTETNAYQRAYLYNYLGLAAWKSGDTAAAAAAFEESRRLHPAYAAPVYNLGVAAFLQKDGARAAVCFSEAAAREPADPRPLEMLGHLHAVSRQWPDAERAWRAALEREPASARLHTRLAIAHLYQARTPEALAELARALEADAAYAPALYNLFMIQARYQKDTTAAAATADRFLKAAPGGTRAAAVRTWLARLPKPGPALPPPVTHTSAAAPRVTPPVAPAPTPPVPVTPPAATNAAPVPPPPPTAKDLVEKARAALRAGEVDAATKMLEQALELDARLAEAHALRAEAAQRDGQLDVALVSLQRALELDREHAGARWSLARLYDEALGRPTDALREYETFAELHPEDTRVRVAAERIRTLRPAPVLVLPPAQTNEPARTPPAPAPVPVITNILVTPPVPTPAPAEPPALDAAPGARPLPVSAAARPRPDPAAAQRALTRASEAQRRGDTERALYEFRQAVEADPRSAPAYYGLGLLYRERGDLDYARECLRRATDLAPQDVNTRYLLAMVLNDGGERPAAVAQLRYLLGRQPDHAPSHHLLGSIYARDPGQLPLARTHLARFVELAPADPAAAAIKLWLRQNP